MPKRQDRLNPIKHHKDSIETLKNLEPVATPDAWRDLSDALFDIAVEALGMAYVIEAGRRPNPQRYERLVELVRSLRGKAPKSPSGSVQQCEIWSPAAENRGAICHGMATGRSFVKACRSHFDTDAAYSRDHNTYWRLPLFDDEITARRWRSDGVGEE
jgi:hypothetical protein